MLNISACVGVLYIIELKNARWNSEIRKLFMEVHFFYQNKIFNITVMHINLSIQRMIMEIYDLWIACSICQLFWLATSETQIPMFVITHWHISSVIAPHISIFRALSSQTEAGFLGNSFLLRCPKGRRHRCYVWTVVRSIQSISLVSRKMVENHSLAESVLQEVQSNIGCVWCRPILHEPLDIKWQTRGGGCRSRIL